jgi:hypothetical protein
VPATIWHLLIHQLPARPLYFRARIRRLLAEAGAVPLKKAVYAIPRSSDSAERLTRIAAEIRAGGGDAFVCESTFQDERDSALLIEAGRKERAAKYARIEREARAIHQQARAAGDDARIRLAKKAGRIRSQLERTRAVDHFETPARHDAGAAVDALERQLRSRGRTAASPTSGLVGRTWVTRRGLHVDRLACAWVVRRFIDAGARFRFADPNDLRARPDEVTFDVPGGRFAHEEGRCSIETLVLRAGIDDAGVRRIAEIVHDIDIKDGRFNHPEKAGVELLVTGIAGNHDDDQERLERGLALFDDLYRSYQKGKRVALKLERSPRPPR